MKKKQTRGNAICSHYVRFNWKSLNFVCNCYFSLGSLFAIIINMKSKWSENGRRRRSEMRNNKRCASTFGVHFHRTVFHFTSQTKMQCNYCNEGARSLQCVFAFRNSANEHRKYETWRYGNCLLFSPGFVAFAATATAMPATKARTGEKKIRIFREDLIMGS